MRDPLVTIVTPSYNQAGFLRAAIESVLGQDYRRIEYIVMDGGSTDGSAGIAAEYGDRLTWISERDRGQSHAINKGWRLGRGAIVAWLNSDDVLLPGAVSAAVRAFHEWPEAGAVYGEGYTMDEAGRLTGRFPATEPFNLWRLTWVCDPILQQSVFFRRAAVEAVGGVREDLHWAMDWDLLVRLGGRFGLRYIPEDLGCLREYGSTKTATGGGRRFREIWRVLRGQTGRWWAPGCWYYGLDTYGWQWRAALERVGLKWLGRRVFHLSRWKIDRVAERAQGLLPGGWAERRLRWMVPRGTRRVRVTGWVPAGPGGQRLVVSAGDEVVGAVLVGDGGFEWDFAVPGELAGGVVSLVFSASWAVDGASWRVVSIDGSHFS